MGKRNLLAEYKRRPGSLILRILVYLAAALTLVCIAFILIYILAKGIPNLTPDLFKLEYTSDNCSMLPALVNTLFMTLLSLLIAGPIGIFAAIYLVEYAKSGNKLVGIVRITAETLTGIPSVPKSYREGSFGLGAGKLRTVFKVVLPSAVPGILSGVILATGRIVGETAALIYTAGSVPRIAKNLFSSTRTLSVHMYLLSKEGLHTDQAYATAVVLLVFVVLINFASDAIAKKMSAKTEKDR